MLKLEDAHDIKKIYEKLGFNVMISCADGGYVVHVEKTFKGE